MRATRRLQAAEMLPNSSVTQGTGWHLLPNQTTEQKKQNTQQPWKEIDVFFFFVFGMGFHQAQL